MPRFSAIEQPESLAKMAYEITRNSILSGQWKIGELYNERQLQPISVFLEHLSEKHCWNLLPRISSSFYPEED